MIWEAIKTGLEILGHWQFWVASIFFSSIFIIMFLLLGLGLSKTMENQKAVICLQNIMKPMHNIL